MSIELTSGTRIYQWDTGHTVSCGTDECHMFKAGDTTRYQIEVEDGTADVPDELLQTRGKLVCMEVEDGKVTSKETFTVQAAPKPEGYTYTATEAKTVTELCAELTETVDEAITAAETATATATAAAETATSAAEAAAASATTATSAAESAAESAEKVAEAEEAAETATEAAATATQAAESATSAAETATAAAETATEAAEAAYSAAQWAAGEYYIGYDADDGGVNHVTFYDLEED